MEKMNRYEKIKNTSPVHAKGDVVKGNGEEMGGIDLWLSLSIEGKRREIIKKQMADHISQMKTLRFDYRA